MFHYQIISICTNFSGVYVHFLTAVNLSFSLRTLATSIPIIETRLGFCSATGSPSTTLFRLRTDCVFLTCLFLLRIVPNLFQACHHKLELKKPKFLFFQEQSVKIEDIKFYRRDSVIAQVFYLPNESFKEDLILFFK